MVFWRKTGGKEWKERKERKEKKRKLEIVDRLISDYIVVDKLDEMNVIINTPEDYKKYGIRMLGECLNSELDIMKVIIDDVIKAIGKNEELSDFGKKMMLRDATEAEK